MNAADTASAAEATRRLSELESLLSDLGLLRTRVRDLDQQFVELLQLTSDGSVVALSIDDELLDERRRALQAERERQGRAIDNRAPELGDVRAQRQDTEERLSLIDAERDIARRNVEQLVQRVESLQGTPDDPLTLDGVEALLQRASHLPERIAATRQAIIDTVRRLHQLLVSPAGEHAAALPASG